MTFADASRNVAEIANREEYGIDVLYELMAAYGRAAASITKLRAGNLNLAEDKKTTVLQRGVVYYKYVHNPESLPSEVEKLEQDPLTARYNPRYLIATDNVSFAAKDTKKNITLEIKWADIDRNIDFFFGWTGDEVTDEKTEAVADRRAADKMRELYFEVEKVNNHKLTDPHNTFRHDLNVFFTRLLFCFFAEDTKVFKNDDKNIFTDSIKDNTQTDGSDLDEFLETLFKTLDTRMEERVGVTSPYSNFPYVNGSIFDTSKSITIPKFNAQARKLILDCGSISWAEINPDIFGSMFQSIVDQAHRSTHGMHYTSVPNIMKTIEPLFLDELRKEFDKNYDNIPKLVKLYDRIAKVKVFDPACGSGNFLIIAYKELRRLENGILARILQDKINSKVTSRIKLENFYGIEIDDFAHEVAILSLYLAKHQMNMEFYEQFKEKIDLIPLKDKANIVLGNAVRLDWQKVCPNVSHTISNETIKQGKLIADDFEQEELLDDVALERKVWDEIYLISNPPYLGQRNQEQSHRNDIDFVFDEADGKYKKLDYVACWFLKGAQYIKGSRARLAFISTDSICQGVQVGQLWSRIFSNNVEITYAYTSFKWSNNAANNAGVSVCCIGMADKNAFVVDKYIFTLGTRRSVQFITPYLTDSNSKILNKHNEPISTLPKMLSGNQPREGGFLMLSDDEKYKILKIEPRISHFIKPMVGANELIKGIRRWCIWIEDGELEDSLAIDELRNRIEGVRKKRTSGNSVERSFANVPHKFVTTRRPKTSQIVIPSVSSESRRYIPIAILDRESIVTSSCFCIFDAELYVFAILNSYTHNIWVKAVTGKLETRINYASNTCYNSFPVRNLSEFEKSELAHLSKNVIFARENHSEKTLAEMYDPDRMPEDLRLAHHELDLAIDRLYRAKPYKNDKERLADLFALYEKMTTNEKET